jgi:flagellar assembly protein FliH
MAQVIRSARIEGEPVVISYGSPPPSATPPPSMEIPQEEEKLEVTLEELRRQAFEDGYREGRDKGEEEAKAERAAEIEQLRALKASLREALEQGIAGLEDVVVEIAFAAACKILGQAAASEEGARSMVREAMRELRTKEGAVLRVSPRDHALIAGELAAEQGIDVAADERVAAGGCLIETAGGTLDARLEIQLRQLVDVLTRAREAQAES